MRDDRSDTYLIKIMYEVFKPICTWLSPTHPDKLNDINKYTVSGITPTWLKRYRVLM